MIGALSQTFVTSAGAVGTGDAGLSQLAGFTEAYETVKYLYGGDVPGDVWRYSLEDGSDMALETMTDSTGNTQPVTATPELATVNGRKNMFVDIRRMLGKTDLGDTKVQSVYALWDSTRPLPIHALA